MPPPTPYAGLNAVLAVFVEGVQHRLSDNLVGIYLQGSFAVGDADAQSDCDFVVAIERDLDEAERDSLDALHASIQALPIRPWRHRLEGSYVPRAILRRWVTEPARSTRCRAAAGGLGGPRHLRQPAARLSVPLPRPWCQEPRALRAAASGLQPLDRVYRMAFWVGLYCRMLHTLETGTVVSKKAASRWAAAKLDQRWRALIERAGAVRDGDRDRAMAPTTTADVAATKAFVRYAMTLDEAALGSKVSSRSSQASTGVRRSFGE